MMKAVIGRRYDTYAPMSDTSGDIDRIASIRLVGQSSDPKLENVNIASPCNNNNTSWLIY